MQNPSSRACVHQTLRSLCPPDMRQTNIHPLTRLPPVCYLWQSSDGHWTAIITHWEFSRDLYLGPLSSLFSQLSTHRSRSICLLCPESDLHDFDDGFDQHRTPFPRSSRSTGVVGSKSGNKSCRRCWIKIRGAGSKVVIKAFCNRLLEEEPQLSLSCGTVLQSDFLIRLISRKHESPEETVPTEKCWAVSCLEIYDSTPTLESCSDFCLSFFDVENRLNILVSQKLNLPWRKKSQISVWAVIWPRQ